MRYEEKQTETRATLSDAKAVSAIEASLNTLKDSNREMSYIINDLYAAVDRILSEDDCAEKSGKDDSIAPYSHLDVFRDELNYYRNSINRLAYLRTRLNNLV